MIELKNDHCAKTSKIPVSDSGYLSFLNSSGKVFWALLQWMDQDVTI